MAIIERYLPFVLVRCTKYTNTKRLAEHIAICTFIGVYRLAEQLDGVNKEPIVIDSILTIVGEDFAEGAKTSDNDQFLFENKDTLYLAKILAEMNLEDCLSRMNFVSVNFDRIQFQRIIDSVMGYLGKEAIKLKNHTQKGV